MTTPKKPRFKKITCALTKHDISIIQELISISDYYYPTIGSWLRSLVREKNLEYLKYNPERRANYLFSFQNDIVTLGDDDFEFSEDIFTKSLSADENLENELIEVSEYTITDV